MTKHGSRCPGCFREKGKDPTCPNCGYDESRQRTPHVLPHRTRLDGRYQVGRVLGKPGGFGVTYLAFDERLELRVAIKEYVPRELAGRGSDGVSVTPYSTGDQKEFEYGLERFLGEAKALARFDHANVAGVRDFFEANGTAYLVMEYYEGKTLKQYLQGQPEKRMDPEIATEIMLRVLDGLKEVHAEGYLHRDIKPSNIYLTQEGRPILIDFGAARLALGEKSRSLSVVLTEGYAPFEQYRRKGDQGPWTDVYGAGATLYRMVTGEKPPPATDRVVDDTLRPPQELDPEVPEGLSRAITDALAPGNKERPQSAEALQDQLQDKFRKGTTTNSNNQQAGGKKTNETHDRAPQSAIREAFRNFFVLSGRSNRLQYFIQNLIPSVSVGIGVGLTVPYNPSQELIILGSALIVIGSFLSVFPTVRRLHDLNFSGWWFCINLIPYLNVLFGLALLFVEGSVGANDYGPDPLEKDRSLVHRVLEGNIAEGEDALLNGEGSRMLLREARTQSPEKKNELLNVAARYGYPEMARLFVAAGADLNATDEDGYTPLQNAARSYPEPEVVSVLLEAGADVNETGNVVRSDSGTLEARHHEVPYPNPIILSFTPLEIAIMADHPEITKMLLKAGANSSSKNCSAPLEIAVMHGDPEVVKVLLRDGADVDITTDVGWTPLHGAAAHGHPKVVKLLIESGADVNKTSGNGETPLDLAALESRGEVMRALLENGGKFNKESIR